MTIGEATQIIDIKSLINALKDKCHRRLRLDINKKLTTLTNLDGILYNKYLVTGINLKVIQIDNFNINYGFVNRVRAKDDVKLEISIFLIAMGFYENIDLSSRDFEVNYQNLFKEKMTFKISKEFILIIKEELDDIFNNIDESFYYIGNSCEHCTYFEQCKENAIKEDSIIMLPIISKGEAKSLIESDISSLEEFEEVLVSGKNLIQLNESILLQKDKYIKGISVLKKENQFKILNNMRLDYNKYTNSNKYMITFQGHSNKDIVYAFGIQKMYKKDEKPHYIILENFVNTKYDLMKHYEAIICYLYDEIKQNLENGKDSVFYVLASYEKKNFSKIINSIFENCKNNRLIIEKTLNVSEYFKFDNYSTGFNKLLPKDFYIEPFIEIKTLIERYLIIDSPFKYTLENVLKILCGDVSINENVIRNSFQFSWALKPTLINKLWKGDLESKENIQKIISSRFFYLSKLITAFENIQEIEIISPEKIDCIPDSSDELDSIERFAIYETISSIKEYKQQFIDLPLEKQIQIGEIIECEVIDKGYNDSKKNYGKDFYKYRFLIKNNKDDVEIENAKYIEKFIDYKDFLKREFNSKHQVDELKLNEDKNVGEAWFQESELKKFYIAKSCFDNQKYEYNKKNEKICNSNINTILKNIKSIKKELFYDQILSNSIGNESFPLKYNELKKLTDSQKYAYENFCKNKTTLLWGPPGTGKTFFLGKILTDVVSENQKLKVLVTGFTHLSIENCLNKISEIDEDCKLSICKVQKIESSISKKITCVESKKEDSYKYNTSKYNIIGSTVYQLKKIIDNEQFDIVVIDEASQLKVSEFLMISKRMRSNTKFLIVGDNKQLSVILKNNYRNYENKKIPLAGSIFDYFANNIKNYSKLNECFRMNQVICEYPSNAIYKENDGSGLKAQGENRYKLIELKEPLEIDPNKYVANIANPDYPVVLCLFKNETAKGNQSLEESALVSDLALFFRKNMSYEDPERFWDCNLSIVSPHHSHINLIKKYLKNRFKEEFNKDNFFVNTVDKMQGQETDVVIVSYGVTDANYARKEKEFIYSFNRLNVAITRPKKKLVVMLSEELIKMDWRLIDNEDMKEDIEFFKNYVRWFEQKIENNQGEKIETTDKTIYRIKMDTDI